MISSDAVSPDVKHPKIETIYYEPYFRNRWETTFVKIDQGVMHQVLCTVFCDLKVNSKSIQLVIIIGV